MNSLDVIVVNISLHCPDLARLLHSVLYLSLCVRCSEA